MSRDPIHIDIPDAPTRGAAEGKYSEYQWAFRTNEKNPKITVFKKQGETSTELGWSIVPLNEERTLWILPTHYWDYSASEYDFYYESDTCERYLIEAFLKSEAFDKPFNGEQITYNNVTYNLVVDRYHDYISNIIYPDNTQYNIVDNSAVHLTGDDIIYGQKTFTASYNVKNDAVKGTAPSADNVRQLQFCDKNGNIIGTVFNTYATDKRNTVGFAVNKANSASDTEDAQLAVHYPASGNPYTYAPTPTDAYSATSGTQIATTGWTASNFVNLAGAQTISGSKTFNDIILLNNSLRLQSTEIEKGTNPSGYKYQILPFYDKNGTVQKNKTGQIYTTYTPSGMLSINMDVFQPVSDSTNSAGISVNYPASGNPYTYAPTPTDAYSATSGTQIATTGWTASNFVNLAGAQTISGEKTFLTTQWANPDGTTTTSVGARKFGSGNGDFYIFMKDSSGNWLNGLQLGPSGGVYIGAWNGTKEVAPFGDNTHNLGTSSRRWKQLYAGTTTIATSDERVKQGIEPLPDDVLDAWGEVEFYRYKFNDAVEEKGFDNARYHTGMVAQRIRDAFSAHGLNAFEYGLLCYDEWEAKAAEVDDDGNEITPALEAGNRYSLRYEECLCMEAAYQRRRADRMEARLEALEAKLK